jgi:hypothetical protein
MKYLVQVREVHYGEIVVDAVDKEDAFEKAGRGYLDDKVKWSEPTVEYRAEPRPDRNRGDAR